MTDKIVVGGQDCTLQQILNILKEDEWMLYDRWTELAYHLEIPVTTVGRLRKDMLFNRRFLTEILREMLIIWIEQRGAKSYLSDLIESLNSIGLRACAEHLEYRIASEVNKTNIDTAEDETGNKKKL